MNASKNMEQRGHTFKIINKNEMRKKTFAISLKKRENYKLRIIQKLLIIMDYLIICIIILFNNNKYNYCLDCINNINNLTNQCFQCPVDFLYQKLIIESDDNTINEILYHNKSISRYGDGEYLIIHGRNIKFQKYDKILAKRLKEILKSDEKNLLVGIYFPFKKKELDLYRDFEANYWRTLCNVHKFEMLKLININKRYYSAGITKFYLKLKDKSRIPKYISKFKKIWGGRDVLIIEGEISRQGIGNDLFNNANSIKRIICPERHSFTVYDKILEAVLEFDKDILVLISLGPTATVLAYDLCKLGYQAIDIGHTDLEYELFLRNETNWIYKNEKKEEKNETEMIKYNSQIIKAILQ